MPDPDNTNQATRMQTSALLLNSSSVTKNEDDDGFYYANSTVANQWEY